MPLRILLLSHKFYPNIGGIETISEFLAHSFLRAGHEVHLLTWSLDESGRVFPFTVIRNPSLRMLFQEHAWSQIIFENNPCLRLSWPSFFYNRPIVIGLQTWLYRINGKVAWQDQLKLKWLERAKRVIACSDAIRKRCWPEALVISNPYQVDTFRILSKVPRTLDFVFIGRLVSDKGADLAIQAMHRLFATMDNLEDLPFKPTLTIIGDGPERAGLKMLVSQLGLENNVVFKGALRGEVLVKCLNRHKFLLVPSVWEEPFGIVVLEGMACGCIPIVSDGGGLPEAVGNAGLIFQRGNVESLVACMKKILNDHNLEEQLRALAPIHLKANDPNLVAKQYLEIIEAAA